MIPRGNLTGLVAVLRVGDKLNQVLSCVAGYCDSIQTAKHVKPHKRKGLIERPRHFVDYMEVTVKGGNGGNGMMSFTSLPKKEWAGPDGGNGGHGGHVIFKASHNVKSLSHLKPLIVGPKGVGGKSKQMDGRNATHMTIEVPLGTVVKSKSGQRLASLDDADATFIAARGGAGGKGNYFFLSNENRAPTLAETGGLGQERELHVELKIMAHAGLIGFPNAGKSSLLQAISRAQPKVSPYPFTTLNPHIGMVLYDDHHQLAVADIPGLIPGSHLNKGMGHSFLRHIERCLCLIYIVDLALEKPWEQLQQLRYELNQYKPGLADRPALLVANKIDLPGAADRMDRLKEWLRNERMNEVSEEAVVRLNEDVCTKKSVSDKTSTKGIKFNSIDNHEKTVDVPFGVIPDDNEELDSVDQMVKRKYSQRLIGESVSEECGEKVDGNGGMEGSETKSSGMLTLAVSAKRKIGIEELLHHLRVMYDSHVSSEDRNKLS